MLKLFRENYIFITGLCIFFTSFVFISIDPDAKKWTGPSTLTLRLIIEVCFLLGAVGYMPLLAMWNINMLDKQEAKKKVIPSGSEFLIDGVVQESTSNER